MQFLVSDADSTFGEDEQLMHLVEADSAAAAIRAFKLQVCIYDTYVSCYIRNGEFGERFWLATEKEREHFEKTGEWLATPALFSRRLRNYFSDRPDLAASYLDYYFSEDTEGELAPEVYAELAEYLLVTKNEFMDVRALPLSGIPVIHQASALPTQTNRSSSDLAPVKSQSKQSD